jgi:hypothetical protein
MKSAMRLLFVALLVAGALSWPTAARAGSPTYCSSGFSTCSSSCQAPMPRCTEYCQTSAPGQYQYTIVEAYCTGGPSLNCTVDYTDIYMSGVPSCMQNCVSTINACMEACLSSYCTGG